MRASNLFQTGKFIAPALLLALLNSAPSLASGYPAGGVFQDYAKVVASTPVYEKINEPRRECWEEEVRYEPRYERQYRRDSNAGSTIIGGLVGGVLGNSIGKGDGRKAATAIGAVLGAVAGDNYADSRRGDYQPSESRVRVEQRCREIDNWSRRLTGYDVTYRYQGQEYTSFMTRDPGNSVRVNVSVSLADN
jgi:uncharacterized protein YcfJ